MNLGRLAERFPAGSVVDHEALDSLETSEDIDVSEGLIRTTAGDLEITSISTNFSNGGCAVAFSGRPKTTAGGEDSADPPDGAAWTLDIKESGRPSMGLTSGLESFQSLSESLEWKQNFHAMKLGEMTTLHERTSGRGPDIKRTVEIKHSGDVGLRPVPAFSRLETTSPRRP